MAERKPPDIDARTGGVVLVKPSSSVPQPLPPRLPTTPIPVSELPPSAVRSPPAKVVMNGPAALIPALSNLTPIPLRELQQQQQQIQTTANTNRVASSRLEMPVGVEIPPSSGPAQQPTIQGATRPVAPATVSSEFISIQVMLFINFYFLFSCIAGAGREPGF